MPTIETAQIGDCLCTIAQRHGFLNCQPLRDDAANSGLLNRPLQPGDLVTVPDLRPREESRSSDKEHTFVVRNTPPALIRFVHGSPDKPYRQDTETTFLNISNFVTNRAGRTMQTPFPTSTVFNQAAHEDLDAFKVEIVDPSGPAEVEFQLEALMPVLDAAGVLTGHEQFPAGAVRDARSLTARAKRVPSRVCYRSPYLRLVADEADKNAVPNQTLLVTDTADGNGADADRLEILDQAVRASFVLSNCPAAAPNQCRVSTVNRPLSPNRQRIRLAMRIFRTTPAGAATVNGITEQMVRLRTMKWFRRLYAQAELAPQFVGPEVELIDPPADNLLVISQATGNAASGLTAAGTASQITFTLSVPPGVTLPDGTRPPDVNVVVPLAGGALPLPPVAVGALVASAAIAASSGTFEAVPFLNPRAFSAPNASCDVLITRTDGLRVAILNEATDDTGLGATGVQVARVNLNQVNIDAPNDSILENPVDMRRILRSADCADDRLDFFVVGGLFGLDNNGNFVNAARGIAVLQGLDVPAAFQPPSPIRLAALMGRSGTTQAMDATDDNPFSYPHEAGHVLHDGFHTVGNTANGRTEMMTGDGTSRNNAVDASKRICDDPVQVRYSFFDPNPTRQAANPGADTTQSITVVARMRQNGSAVIGPW